MLTASTCIRRPHHPPLYVPSTIPRYHPPMNLHHVLLPLLIPYMNRWHSQDEAFRCRPVFIIFVFSLYIVYRALSSLGALYHTPQHRVLYACLHSVLCNLSVHRIVCDEKQMYSIQSPLALSYDRDSGCRVITCRAATVQSC